MKKICFIANPHSGSNRNRKLARLIAENLAHDQYEYVLRYTERAGHAVQLTREAIEAGFDMIVACGGDGSVNEIAGQLVGTKVVLGVLPCGSGNGFAMHLGIGRDVAKAIVHLNNGKIITIDTCTMNGKPFVNLAGIGFDAMVARHLHRKKARGFRAYFFGALREIRNFKAQPFKITINQQTFHRNCILIEIANAPVYGYGFTIVPHARPHDGRMEVLIAKEAPKWRYVMELWRFFNHSFHQSPLVECFSGTEITVIPSRPTAIHLDGEGWRLNEPARFEIQPRTLQVMVPKVYAENLSAVQLRTNKMML